MVRVLALLLTTVALIEGCYGEISGFVTDPANAPVPGSSAKVTNRAPGLVASLPNSEGEVLCIVPYPRHT